MTQKELAKYRRNEAAKMLAEGKTDKEVREALGVSRTWISEYRRKRSEAVEYCCKCCPSGTVTFHEEDRSAECSKCGQFYYRYTLERHASKASSVVARIPDHYAEKEYNSLPNGLGKSWLAKE